jgi:O-antigen/teichoic acid export membrane protein
MKAPRASGSRRGLRGTILVFLGEALAVPSGLVTVAILIRHLAPAVFGQYALAIAMVVWVEWTVGAFFNRASIKLIAEQDQWQRAGTTITQLHLIAGGAAGVVVWLTAPIAASLLHEPQIEPLLHILAFDIPLFCVAQAHRHILVSLGSYGARAVVAAVRWLVRAGLMIGLVLLGFGGEGAIWGVIAGSAVEIACCRIWVRPTLRGGMQAPLGAFLRTSAALFVAAMGLRMLDKVDLFALSALGGGTVEAGLYAAAQNLAIGGSLFSLALSPILLADITAALKNEDRDAARQSIRTALRVIWLLVPFAALGAGSADEICQLVFGPAFRGAGVALGPLLMSSLAMMFISAMTSSLAADGRARHTITNTLPLVPLAIAAYLMLIPRAGPAGAAAATLMTTLVGAVVALWVMYDGWKVWSPRATVVRSTALAVSAYLVGGAWPTDGVGLLVKLLVGSLIIAGGFIAAGELSLPERSAMRQLAARAIGQPMPRHA